MARRCACSAPFRGWNGAEFARLGGLHRNTFLNSPKLLDRGLRLKADPRLRFAGQITGCEGYVESAAIGLIAGRMAAAERRGEALTPPPPTTAHRRAAQPHHRRPYRDHRRRTALVPADERQFRPVSADGFYAQSARRQEIARAGKGGGEKAGDVGAGGVGFAGVAGGVKAPIGEEVVVVKGRRKTCQKAWADTMAMSKASVPATKTCRVRRNSKVPTGKGANKQEQYSGRPKHIDRGR